MVVSPMEALADVGYTWQTWGGGWNPADAIHFELPGASDYARQLAKVYGFVETAGSVFAPHSFLPQLAGELTGHEELTEVAPASVSGLLGSIYDYFSK
jgi:hypothetical protein